MPSKIDLHLHFDILKFATMKRVRNMSAQHFALIFKFERAAVFTITLLIMYQTFL